MLIVKEAITYNIKVNIHFKRNIERAKINLYNIGKTNMILKMPQLVTITNFIQLVSPQPVDQFSQTKLCWEAPNEGYLHICRMYKSDNK